MITTNNLKIHECLKEIEKICEDFNNGIDNLDEFQKFEMMRSLDYAVFEKIKENDLPELIRLVNENEIIFKNQIFSKKIVDRLLELISRIKGYGKLAITFSSLNGLINQLVDIKIIIQDIYNAIVALDNTNTLLDEELRPKIEEVTKQLEDIERAKLSLQNNDIYGVFKKYEEALNAESNIYEKRFFCTIGIGTCLAIFVIFIPNMFSDFKIELWNYIFLKILIISITITLSTYFLRRSVHLRKQSDEMGRTAFEMDALPSFMSSLDKEQSQSVTLELIQKYFGRDVDQTHIDKIGSLLQDQISSGTELIKASAEILKAKNEVKD